MRSRVFSFSVICVLLLACSDRASAQDGSDLEARIQFDQGVLLYPEGTRFTRRKRNIALKRLAKTHPELLEIAETYRHCLPPKPGGALSLMDEAPDADVLFVAHRGLEGLANTTDLLSGSVVGAEIQVKMWRVLASEIPRGEVRRRWLFEWWKRIDDFVATGHWLPA